MTSHQPKGDLFGRPHVEGCPLTTQVVSDIVPGEPRIVNINGTIQLDREEPLDLERYAEHLGCCEYLPEKFAALKLVRRKPYTTALIFRCGKIVCVGTVSIEMLLDGIRWVVKTLSDFEDEPMATPKITIENIVVTCKIPSPINLRKLYSVSWLHCHYEPEIFPGLTFVYNPPELNSREERKHRKYSYMARLKGQCPVNDPKMIEMTNEIEKQRVLKNKASRIKLVVFQSGSINIVGCKRMADVAQVYQWLKSICLHDDVRQVFGIETRSTKRKSQEIS